jgi:HD-like signal output (HDOD) protein
MKWLQSGADRERLRDRLRDTIARLSDTGILPTLPETARTAMRLAQDIDADLDKLCTVVATDIGLVACVLRLANSAAYARRRQAVTLQAAVTTIGLRKVINIVVAASTRSVYGAAGEHAGPLWNHALLVGLGAEELRRVRGGAEPEMAFLPGMFHDLGRIAFFLADPAAFADFERTAARRWRNPTAIEVDRFGFDHAEVGGALAEQWNLSPEQCDAIRWHHEPGRATAGHELAVLINAADALAHRIEGRSSADGKELPDTPLALSDDEWTARAARVRETFEEHRAAFG